MKRKISVLLLTIMTLTALPVSAFEGYNIEELKNVTLTEEFENYKNQEGIWSYKNIKFRQASNEDDRGALIQLVDRVLFKFYSYRAELDLLTEALNKAETKEEIERASYNLEQFYYTIQLPAEREILRSTIENPYFKRYSLSNNIYYNLEEYIKEADKLIEENIAGSKTIVEIENILNLDDDLKTVFEVRNNFKNSKQIPLGAFENNSLVLALQKIRNVQSELLNNYYRIREEATIYGAEQRLKDDKRHKALLKELDTLMQDEEVVEFFNKYNYEEYNHYKIPDMNAYFGELI